MRPDACPAEDEMDLKEAGGLISTRHPWEVVRFEVISDILSNDLQGLFSGQGLILDIGCGDAYVAGRLTGLMPHARIMAVDTSIEGDLQPGGSGRIVFYRSVEEALERADVRIDAVFMFDLLDHIKDEGPFIGSLLRSRLITDDTVFVVTVPAFQSLYSEHDRFLGHYRRYDRASLRKAMLDSGLREVRSGYFFWSLLPARKLQQWYWKIRGTERSYSGIGSWRGGRFVTKLFKGLLMLDHKISKISGYNIPGLSVYMVCRRSA